MKKLIRFLIRMSSEPAEEIIRYQIAKFIPWYHLHRNPPRGAEKINTEG